MSQDDNIQFYDKDGELINLSATFAGGVHTLRAVVDSAPITDFFHAVAEGDVPGHSLIHKFGKLAGITTNYQPLTHGGVYPTPQVAGAVNVRVKAGGNAQDRQNGTGARSIHVEGITTDGSIVSEILLTHATDGTLAGPDGIVDFIRIYRMHVETSGTHANPSAGSHLAKIIVEDTGGVEDWAHIDGAIAAGDFPRG